MQELVTQAVGSLVLGTMLCAIPYFALKRLVPFWRLVAVFAVAHLALIATGLADGTNAATVLLPLAAAWITGKFTPPPRA